MVPPTRMTAVELAVGCWISFCFVLFCVWFGWGFFVCFFRAAPLTYGGSHARAWIRAAADHNHSNMGSELHLWPIDGNTRSLTHWTRPGIEPASSWILVGFLTAKPQWELLNKFWRYSHCDCYETWWRQWIKSESKCLSEQVKTWKCYQLRWGRLEVE